MVVATKRSFGRGRDVGALGGDIEEKPKGELTMSIDILSWAFLASYAIHLVDETTMNGGFIQWI